MKEFTIYCDGSSAPKTSKNAGWGIAIPIRPNDYVVYAGHLKSPSTNNIGEAWALTNAIKIFAKQPIKLTIFSDSEYALKFVRNRANWERDGLPPANNDIILQCWKNWDEFKSNGGFLDPRWCKGHDKIVGNEVADFAAKAGRDSDIHFGSKGLIEMKYGVNIVKAVYFNSQDQFNSFIK
ncbi:ribonuclease H [Vibrio phage vB_VchM_Kuja]|uniref:ribonuclease H n=1 Tax=Vibrio phage vB_VchM_Kuja TaxID=2686437 RepID=A0A6B9J8Z8_9CAUD|nr:Rnase H [Vibrio phage vB_VchM_Kuja]QGZ16003.1 ribonuclease H [Vibrio phage vB_VchM_Kuja]